MAVIKYRIGDQVFTLDIPIKKDQNTFHAINAAGNTVTANSSNSELNLLGENGISFKINPDNSTITIIGPSDSYTGKIAIENINNHNEDETAHPFILDSISDIKTITEAKTTNYTFNTKSEMDTWLLDTNNKEKLIKGDTFYIDSLEEHDYWWNGTEIKEIEAKVVDLTPEQMAALKGDQGISVSAISFDANGHLIITLYDPSTKTSNVVDVGAAETAALIAEINQAVTNTTASKTAAEQSATNAKNSEVAAKADADRATSEADRVDGSLESIFDPDTASIIKITPTMIIGGLSKTTGAFVERSDSVVTNDFVPVEPSVNYTFINDAAVTMCVIYYDSNKNWISDFNGAGYTYYASGDTDISPSNAAYLKFYSSESLGNLNIKFEIETATKTNLAMFRKIYFGNDLSQYQVFAKDIDTKSLQVQALQNEYAILTLRAPDANPKESTICLKCSGDKTSQFVDFSCMRYDDSSPDIPGTVEIVMQKRGSLHPLPVFCINFNDGGGAGRVNKLVVDPDCIPIRLTKDGLVVRRNNNFDNNAADSELVNVNLADMSDNLASTQVKIATIDQELTSHTNILSQVNINQEARQTITGYDKILSLPKNAANGNASFGLKGMTAQNLVKNDANSFGIAGFRGVFYNTTLSNQELVCTVSALLTEDARMYQYCQNIKSHKYYWCFDILPKYSNNTSIRNGNTILPISSIIAEVWNRKSGTIVGDGISSSLLTITHSTATNYIIGDVVKFRQIKFIDLTALFGSGNEPDAATCDKMFPTWFDGMQSVNSRGRVKSVGKNLFDKSKRSLLKSVNPSTGVVCGATMSDLSDYIKVEPNTQYTLSTQNGTSSVGNICFYDANKNYVSGEYRGFGILSIPPNANYVRITVLQTEVDSCQLELGTTATPYEPYISTSKYINSVAPLRRVPNGTADEIRQKADGYELVQRCGQYLATGADITEFFNTTSDYIDAVVFGNISNKLQPPSIAFKNVIQNGVVFGSYPQIPTKSWIDFISEDIGKFNTNSDTRYNLLVCFAKGQIADLQAAKDYFNANPTWLIYQLATPIITPIDTSGTLLSYPSGSVYLEPITADAGAYNNGISILATGFPIEVLETLSKVDFVTGVETTLDVSTAVIAEDGLSFTHPNLVNGDIVFFTYSFADDAPQGNKTFGYYDSRYVIKDTVTSKFYQWGITVADGVPAFDLVEV